jgi:hypothetical protein
MLVTTRTHAPATRPGGEHRSGSCRDLSCQSVPSHAVFMTVRGHAEISNPVFAGLALARLAMAGLIISASELPDRAPLTDAPMRRLMCSPCWRSSARGGRAMGVERLPSGTTGARPRSGFLPGTRPHRPALGRSRPAWTVFDDLDWNHHPPEVPSLVTSGPALAFIVLAATPMLAPLPSAAPLE